MLFQSTQVSHPTNSSSAQVQDDFCTISDSDLSELEYNATELYSSPEPKDEYEFAKLYLSLNNFDMRAIAHKPSQFIKKCTLVGKKTKQCTKLMAQGGNRVSSSAVIFTMVVGSVTTFS